MTSGEFPRAPVGFYDNDCHLFRAADILAVWLRSRIAAKRLIKALNSPPGDKLVSVVRGEKWPDTLHSRLVVTALITNTGRMRARIWILAPRRRRGSLKAAKNRSPNSSFLHFCCGFPGMICNCNWMLVVTLLIGFKFNYTYQSRHWKVFISPISCFSPLPRLFFIFPLSLLSSLFSFICSFLFFPSHLSACLYSVVMNISFVVYTKLDNHNL